MARPADPKPRLKKGYWSVRIRGKDCHLGKDRRTAFAKFHRMMADSMGNDPGTGRPNTINGAIEVWLRLHKSPKHLVWLRHFVTFAGTVSLADVTPGLRWAGTTPRNCASLRRARGTATARPPDGTPGTGSDTSACLAGIPADVSLRYVLSESNGASNMIALPSMHQLLHASLALVQVPKKCL